jgi:hypothetical protein
MLGLARSASAMKALCIAEFLQRQDFWQKFVKSGAYNGVLSPSHIFLVLEKTSIRVAIPQLKAVSTCCRAPLNFEF